MSSGEIAQPRNALRLALARADRGVAGALARWVLGLLLVLLRRVPAGVIPLRPLRGLLPAAAGDRTWVATDGDPGFECIPPWWRLPRGWCHLAMQVSAPEGSGCVKLYYDAVGGYSEHGRLLLGPPQGDAAIEMVAYLPLALRRLRLDPTEAPCVFHQGPLVVEPLPLLRQAKLGARAIAGRLRRRLSAPYWRVRRLLGAKPLLPSARRESVEYPQWLQQVEPGENDLQLMRTRSAALAAPAIISIVMPVHDPEPSELQAALDSVLAQAYPHWELCICDDASTTTAIVGLLRAYALREPRIRLHRRDRNGGIAAASADAFALARGAFVAFLDHDDLLPPWALYRVAAALGTGHWDIAYSDEDKLDERGRRCDPHFKPDWNEDLLHSINYFGHLLVIRRNLIGSAGGFRSGFDGSQDYDLILRCVAATTPDRILHIPGVLYHWRKSRGSTAQQLGAKSQAHPSGIAALRARFADNLGTEVVDGPFPTSYRVRHPLPASRPRVTIMIPTRDGAEQLERCVESILRRSTYPNYELLIINNQSRDPATLAYLLQLAGRASISVADYDHPFNFSAINNFGAERAQGDALLLLNDDVEVLTPDWLDEMVSRLYRPGVGAVGAKLYYPDGRVQHAGVILGIGGIAGHSHKYYPGHHSGYFGRLVLPQTVAAVTGACLLVKREFYRELGGLDERNLPVAFNDVDFCLRLRERGLRSVWTPFAELIHFESLSRGAEDTAAKRERFSREVRYMRARWGKLLDADPCYNPYLSLEHEDFSLSSTPRPYFSELH